MYCRYIFILIISLIFSSCATYYQKNEQYQLMVEAGKYSEANKLLDKSAKDAEGKNRVLYFFNKGLTEHMLGNYQQSNIWFQKADYYIEDFSREVGYEALALISNPSIRPYKPEDFESVMIHFYETLNYLYLNNYESALIECRRLNLQLNRLNDKYKKHKNKYSEDAFALNLMGMIYEASGDYNNAFIAYRNSVTSYETIYKPLFGLDVPNQLKYDVIRSAYKTGFQAEAKEYETKFNITYQPEAKENGTLLFFWMNGFGPIKSEWSINFVNTGYNDGFITLADSDAGITFPLYIGGNTSEEQGALKELSALRIAFPKYITRPNSYQRAWLQVNNQQIPLEMGEDINAIAFQSLKDRMLREIGSSIARLATKKAMEAYVRSKNENMGTIVSIVNALTEKADTRNWQTLPYSISYTRVSLPAGSHDINLGATGQRTTTVPLKFDIQAGKTTFFNFHHF